MNLKKKKILASKTLGVGRERIVFLGPRKDEIKEAITKQDIRDLHKEGAIIIKPIKGRRKVEPRKRRRVGKVRKYVNTRKQDYVKLTRKLRRLLPALMNQGKINREKANDLRKKIRNRIFKNKSQFMDYIQGKK